jgi:MFS family permease
MTVLCGLAHNFPELLLARIGVGAGEACLMPAAFSLIADYFPPRQRGRAIGVYMTATTAGAGIAMVLGGAVMRSFHGARVVALPLFGQVADWQAAFIIVGTPGVLLAFLLMATLREVPRQGRAPRAAVSGEAEDGDPSLIAYIRAHPAVFIHIYGTFTLVSFTAFALSPWTATVFIRQFGFSAGKAGEWIGVCTTICGMTGCLAGGFMGDRWTARGARGGKLRCAVVWWLAAFPSIVVLLLSRSPVLSILAVGVFLFFDFFCYAAGPSMLQEMVPARLRGRSTALWYLLNGLTGIGISPVMVPLIEEHVFHSPAALMPAIAVTALPAIVLGLFLSWRGLDIFDRVRLAHPEASAADRRRRAGGLALEPSA